MSSLMDKWKSSGFGLTLSRRHVGSSKSADEIVKDDTLKLKRVKVATILLSNNLDLLAALCQSNFVGDAAAAIASTIISLLRQMSDETCSAFVKRILKTKILIYASKGKRLTDLLRDNSMSTMILTSFARSMGSLYLKETLTEPLTELLVYFTEPDSLNNKDDALSNSSHSISSTVPTEKHMESERKLLSACLSILNSILTNFDKMPNDLKQICRYLKMEVEDIVVTASQGLLVSESSDIGGLKALEDKDFSRRSSPMQRRISAMQASEKSQPILKEESEEFETVQNADSQNVLANNIKIILEHAKDRNSSDSAKSVAEPNGREQFTPLPSRKELPPSDMSPKLVRSASELSSVLTMSDGSMSRSVTVMSNMTDDIGETFEDPILTLSERVVGTFLFLRFFVPAVTAPESYGFLQGKVNAPARKKLILCGKILNGFCSEANFRQKEPQLVGVTEFLELNKPNLKSFITKVTLLESEGAEKQPAVVANAKRKGGAEIVADEHLMLYLSRSISRIEKDMGSILRSMTVQETKHVEEAFQELKQELEDYNQLLDGPVKEPTFLAKMGLRLELFKKAQSTLWSNLQKSKSTDDIANMQPEHTPAVRRRKPSTGSLSGVSRKSPK